MSPLPGRPQDGSAALPQRIESLAARIAAGCGVEPLRGFELARLTSFRIGGPADLFLDPPSVGALATALREAKGLAVPVTLLGGGTNVLISDAGVRGLVVHPGKAFDYLRWSGGESGSNDGRESTVGSGEATAFLEAGSGTRMIRTVKEAVSCGYKGLEFAAGIPGSVGGALLMNAGAFGGEIADTVDCIGTVGEDGKISELSRRELDFSYRKLALDRGLVVTWIRFRLLRASVGRLQERVAAVQAKRRRKQPAGLPNAGSVFKNPPREYAGRLIERAGLKGRAVGGARVSSEHANFIVNAGGARAEEVRDLMGLIQGEVWMKCGVWLEPEVRLVGDWG